MAKGRKYYVVWKGLHPGVFDNWEDARIQVENFRGAKFKAFPTMESAVAAFRTPQEGEENYLARLLIANMEQKPVGDAPKPAKKAASREDIPLRNPETWLRHPGVCADAWAVDAACKGNPGPMEYRGVEVATGREIFRVGPLEGGTNNIGEYLAIIHAMALMKKRGEHHVIYTDSVTALSWLRRRHSNTKIIPTRENEKVIDLLVRGNIWIGDNDVTEEIRKWDTDAWGEIPADFGRK